MTISEVLKAKREAEERVAAKEEAENVVSTEDEVEAEEAAHKAAEEAAKSSEVALTRGESSTSDLASLVFKTLEDLQKEQQLVRSRLDQKI